MGTSKIGSNIDRTARQIVDRRSLIWKDYDRALSDISELDRYADRYSNPDINQKLAPLTSENTPSTEVLAAIAQIKEQEIKIGAANAEIQSTLAKIKALKSQGYGVILFLIMIILFVIIFLIIKSFS